MATANLRNDRRATHDSKHPVSPVAGPYGHPFHPMLVTIPIGAWVMALIFDIVSHIADDGAPFAKGAYWLVGIGIIGALLAAVFGLMDLLTIPNGTKVYTMGLTHMVLNLVVVVLMVISFFTRHSHQLDASGTPWWIVILTAVGLLILAVSGWIGGTLAYHFGVRVADEATQSEGFQATS